jgi:hypothetical protein
MRRCPECRSPNPDPARACSRCGAELSPLKPGPALGGLLDARAAARAALALPALLLAYSLPFGWAFYPPGQELRQAAFFALSGLSLGLALGWVQAARAWAWALAGLAGGLLAYACNWLYMDQHAVYKAVFWLSEWMDPADSPLIPFRALQMLRALSLALPLLLLRPLLSGAWPRLALDLLFVAASALARAQVLGPPLGGAHPLAHLAWASLSLLLLLYGLGRGDKAAVFA